MSCSRCLWFIVRFAVGSADFNVTLLLPCKCRMDPLRQQQWRLRAGEQCCVTLPSSCANCLHTVPIALVLAVVRYCSASAAVDESGDDDDESVDESDDVDLALLQRMRAHRHSG